jgi:hypothetical protein
MGQGASNPSARFPVPHGCLPRSVSSPSLCPLHVHPPLRCVLRRHPHTCRPPHHAGHLLTAHADAQQRLTLRASPVTGAINTPCQVRRRPCLAGPAPPPTAFIAFAGSIAASAFPAGSTLLRPFRLDPPSLWLDRVFPAGSVAAVAFSAGSVVSPSILPQARPP